MYTYERSCACTAHRSPDAKNIKILPPPKGAHNKGTRRKKKGPKCIHKKKKKTVTHTRDPCPTQAPLSVIIEELSRAKNAAAADNTVLDI